MQRIIINGQEVDLDAIAQVTNGKTKKSEPKERRETFIGDALEIFDLHASIDIQPSNGNKITVSVTGPESIVDRLQIIEKDGTVSISDSKGGKSNGATIIQNIRGGHIGSMTIDNVGTIGNFGGVTVISGDGIVINTGDTESAKLSLKITAPIYTEVNLSDIIGDTTIGNLQGDIDLDLSGKNSVEIANVRHLKVDASGVCCVIVKEITGSANLDLSGNSKVELKSGCVDKLTIDASGMGKVDAYITAERANLDASGMCKIFVKKVTGRCRKDVSGMSRIDVG